MNKKGFILIEVIVGLVLLAIVAMTCLPIFMTAKSSLTRAKDKTQMIFIAESTIEQIAAFNPNYIDEDEYLFDIQPQELINILKLEPLVRLELPLDLENEEFNYSCIIIKEEKFKGIWEIEVEVFLKKERDKNNVNIKVYIPSPLQLKDI